MLLVDFTQPFGWPWFVIAVILVIVSAVLIFVSGAAEWRYVAVVSYTSGIVGIIAALYAVLWVIRLGAILLL